MSTIAAQDKVQQHIDRLVKLVDQGILDKKDLSGLIRSVYLGFSNKGEKSDNEEKELAIKAKQQEEKAKDALKNQRRYRARKSPETLKIRNMVKGPMKRRFELQCTINDSILFGDSPPKRLDEVLFDRACASPLAKIFTRNAAALVNVPGKKVASICR